MVVRHGGEYVYMKIVIENFYLLFKTGPLVIIGRNAAQPTPVIDTKTNKMILQVQLCGETFLELICNLVVCAAEPERFHSD